MSVERRITEAELVSGALRFSSAEAARLAMPEFSSPVRVRFAGEESQADWNASARTLTGEALHEELALEASIGHLLRWSRQHDVLVLEVATARASSYPVRPRPSADVFARDPFLPAEVAPSAARPVARTGFRGPRRSTRPPQRARVEADYDWPVPDVGILRESVEDLNQAISDGGWDTPEQFSLRLRGEKLSTINDFDELVAADSAAIDPMEHQYAAARKALGVMGGRAVLADEVGLGKTIEAGLVASELRVRGLARRILVITPATLRQQWQEELKQKFAIDAAIVATGTDPMTAESLILSLQLATRPSEALQQQDWDLVIVDEAHRIAGAGAKKRRALLTGLRSRYMLFLTATPVQNDLRELYRLVEVLRPGTFESQRQFERLYIDGADPRRPRNPQDLRRLVSNVMIRTTRAQAGLDRVKRFPVDRPIALSDDERRSYDLVVRILREVLTGPSDHFRREQLARALTLSPRGLYESARKAADQHPDPRAQAVLRELADLAVEQGPSSRQRELTRLVQQWIDDPDKGRVIVFTQQSRVLADLIRVLDQSGIQAVAYHGGLTANAKSAALEEFRAGTRVLVSTEAGAEGLNLQHANAVINYDLPWNPMRIEQRIGRVHRVTQTRDVHVANFFALGTVDERVYEILVHKLRMFELLFGQITTILGELEDADTKGKTFEAQIKDALYAPDDSRMTAALQALARKAELASAKAGEQLVDSGGVSAWMSPTLDHRATMGRDAEELRPEVTARKRERQQAVESFARDWLVHFGGEILHETTDFVAARVHGSMRDAMGGDTIYLAFSPQGLAEHPGAELVAVGTPLFEDLVSSARESGDLLGWQPDLPDVTDLERFPPAPALPGLTFLSRALRPPAVAGGRATWRVSDEDTRVSDEVVTVGWGNAEVVEGIHRPVPAELRPPWSRTGDGKRPTPAERAAQESIRALTQLKNRWQATLADAFVEDRERRHASVRAQLPEIRDPAVLAGLQQQLTSIVAEQPPRVRVRASLLALEVVAATTAAVTENWQLPDGRRVSVTAGWDAATDRISLHTSTGRPISQLAVCDDLHPLDAGDLSTCPGCSSTSCSTCSPGRRARHRCERCGHEMCGRCLDPQVTCPVCARAVCAACRADEVCQTCAVPERHDSSVAAESLRRVLSPAALATVMGPLLATNLTVRLGTDATRTVLAFAGASRREVAVLDGQGRLVRWWTLGDTDPALLAEALDVARHAGLSGNLVLVDRTERVPGRPEEVAPSLVLECLRHSQVVWSTADATWQAGTAPADAPRPSVPAEPHLTAVLSALLPAGAGSGIELRRRSVESEQLTWIDVYGLHRRNAHGAEVQEEHARWEAPAPHHSDALAALVPTWPRRPALLTASSLSTMTAVVSALDGERFLHVLAPPEAVPLVSRTAAPLDGDRPPGVDSEPPVPLGALFDWARPRLEDVTAVPGCPVDPRAGLRLVERSVGDCEIRSVETLFRTRTSGHPTAPFALTLSGRATYPLGGRSVVPLYDPALAIGSSQGVLADLAAASSRAVRAPQARPVAPAEPELLELLALQVAAPATVPLRERWRGEDGHGVDVRGVWDATTNRVTLFGADGRPIDVLATCSEQHPVDASRRAQCPQCETISCDACPPARRPATACGRCHRTVCDGCLPADGRTCPVCERRVCSGCWTGTTCRTCTADRVLTAEQAAQELPDVLTALTAWGLPVRYGADDERMVVVVAGTQRREIVLLDGSRSVLRWWTLSEPDPQLLAEALAAVRACREHGDVVVSTSDEATAAAPPDLSNGGLEVARSCHRSTVWAVGGHVLPRQDVPRDAAEVGPERAPADRRVAMLGLVPDVSALGRSPLATRLRNLEHARVLWIDRHGLHGWWATGQDVQTADLPWTSPDERALARLATATGRWAHRPQAILAAELDSVHAVVSSVDVFRLVHVLGVPHIDDHVCWDVDGLLDKESALAQGYRIFGRLIPLNIAAAVTEPPALPGVVSRGRLAAITAQSWVLNLAPHQEQVPFAALRDLGPTPPPSSGLGLEPGGPRRSPDAGQVLRRELESLVPSRELPQPLPAVLGVRREFVVATRRGSTPGAYLVFPRDLPSGVTEAMTGWHVEHPVACDNAHVTPAAPECAYCERQLCVHCPGPTRSCPTCAVLVCDACAQGKPTCPACTSLQPPGFIRRRSIVSRVPHAEAVLVGKDRLHTVTLILAAGGVIREVDGLPQRGQDYVRLDAHFQGLPWARP